MSQLTEEQHERLNQIRERARETPHYFTADFHFLLSLLDSDSQAAEATGSYRLNEGDGIRSVSATTSEAAVTMGQIIAHNRNAAFSLGMKAMRSACVDAIKSLRATPHGAAYSNAINDALQRIESVTLREQGQ